MQNGDRAFKILLLLLVIGVWGLLLSPFIRGYASQKPGRTDKPEPAKPPQAQRQYSAWVDDDKSGTLQIGGDGTISLTAAGLMKALEETPRQGWKAHSVVHKSRGGGYGGGYVVIVEK
jgi:hypothetical protein